MKFSDLDLAYAAYKEDPEKVHELFQLCLAFAKIKLSWYIQGQDREDVAQDAAWAAWANLSKLKDDSLFGFWFLKIIANKKNDHLRLKYRDKGLLDDLTNAQYIFAEDDMTFAYGRLKEASGTNQEIIDHVLTGMTYAEVGETLGISEGAVNQRIRGMKTRYLNSLNALESKKVN